MRALAHYTNRDKFSTAYGTAMNFVRKWSEQLVDTSASGWEPPTGSLRFSKLCPIHGPYEPPFLLLLRRTRAGTHVSICSFIFCSRFSTSFHFEISLNRLDMQSNSVFELTRLLWEWHIGDQIGIFNAHYTISGNQRKLTRWLHHDHINWTVRRF